jgi:hypothetical protein
VTPEFVSITFNGKIHFAEVITNENDPDKSQQRGTNAVVSSAGGTRTGRIRHDGFFELFLYYFAVVVFPWMVSIPVDSTVGSGACLSALIQ